MPAHPNPTALLHLLRDVLRLVRQAGDPVEQLRWTLAYLSHNSPHPLEVFVLDQDADPADRVRQLREALLDAVRTGLADEWAASDVEGEVGLLMEELAAEGLGAEIPCSA